VVDGAPLNDTLTTHSSTAQCWNYQHFPEQFHQLLQERSLHATRPSAYHRSRVPRRTRNYQRYNGCVLSLVCVDDHGCLLGL